MLITTCLVFELGIIISFLSTARPNWNGPTSKYWSDSQCQNLETLTSETVTKCKWSCEAKSLCTAFNYHPNVGCELRACSLPVPDPTGICKKGFCNYKGYYLNTGTNTLIVLKHSNLVFNLCVPRIDL